MMNENELKTHLLNVNHLENIIAQEVISLFEFSALKKKLCID